MKETTRLFGWMAGMVTTCWALAGVAGCESAQSPPGVVPDTSDIVAPDDAETPDTDDAETPETADEVAQDVGPPPECGPGSVNPLPDPCNDYDACTTDACVEGRCVHEDVAECCKTDDQCDDGVACTDDRCNRIQSRCESVRGDSFCCVTAADCEDFDACTENVCAANRCVYPVRPSCPVGNPALCNDQNDCTIDQWSSNGRCNYVSVESTSGGQCCGSDAACDDGDATTFDRCQEARCWHGPVACESDAACAGPGFCSSGACVEGACVYPDAATCCETDAACSDGLDETTDSCVEHACVHALVERRCTTDDECPRPNACVAAACVNGYCSASPVIEAGCCVTAADCAAPARCEDVACVEFQCVITPTTEDRPFWSADFANLDGWTVVADASGARWQLRASQYMSAPTSLYYGTTAGGFDVGATKGTITSPGVTLPAGVASDALSVSLWRNLLVEAISSRDLVTLDVVSGGGEPIRIWDKSYDSGPGLSWRLDTVPLPAGLSGTIQLRFGFDTIDGVDNVGQGAFIDDLRVLAPCTPPQR